MEGMGPLHLRFILYPGGLPEPEALSFTPHHPAGYAAPLLPRGREGLFPYASTSACWRFRMLFSRLMGASIDVFGLDGSVRPSTVTSIMPN